MNEFDKRMLKKSPEELQAYLAFKRKGGKVPAKKGKGSYNRKNWKKEVAQDENCLHCCVVCVLWCALDCINGTMV